MKEAISRAVARCTIVVSLLWLVGATFRDRWVLTSLAYYIPPVLVFVLALLSTVLARKRRRGALDLVVMAMGLVAFTKMAVVDFRYHPPGKTRDGSLRIVHWNIANGRLGPERIAHALREDRADIILLSECRDKAAKEMALTAIEDGRAIAQAGMTLASRWPVRFQDVLALDHGLAWCGRVDTPLGPLDILMVDLDSAPWRSRGPRLDIISGWVGDHDPAVPLVLAGDLNTPRDSFHLEPLRERLYHGYEVAGRGWPYTWPLPLPVYAIDHLWVSRRVYVNTYDLPISPFSDHRRQVADILLKRRLPPAR